MNVQNTMTEAQWQVPKVDAEFPSAAHVKRFLEVWSSGLYAKEDLVNRPQPILAEHHVNIDPALIRVLYESKFLRGKSGKLDLLPAQFDAFREFMLTKIRWRQQIRSGSAPANPIYRAFRERQIERCQVELGNDQNTAIVHVPVVFELTRGCSVKCWFCALDAPPLTAVYDYSSENARFFREVLQVVKDVIGPASKWASSYWGTDPLDNPDQEKFSMDFREILGMYPQTTTAIPLRSVERTKRVLQLSHANGCLVNRFSVRNASQLKAIHRTFTAEELLYTELVLQNVECDTVKARAGRLIHFAEDLPKLAEIDERKLLKMLNEREPELAAKATSILINLPGATQPVVKTNKYSTTQEPSEEFNVAINVPGTTSCLTGFKINMVDRRVELLSPCPATEQWPLGHIIFEEGRFDTPEELRTLMEGMISRNMRGEILPETVVRFVPRLSYVEDPDGFRLSSVFGSVGCQRPSQPDYLHRLGRMISEGTHPAGEIAMCCFYEFGVPEPYTMGSLKNLLDRGVIAEEPRPVEVPLEEAVVG
jgi:radical SAM family RiPP maturation amino acid epimerase